MLSLHRRGGGGRTRSRGVFCVALVGFRGRRPAPVITPRRRLAVVRASLVTRSQVYAQIQESKR